MPIETSDLEYRLSVKTGSEGNSQAQADVNQSLGKYISTTLVSGSPDNNLFDDVSGDESTAGHTDYRCIFVHNDHATLTLQGAFLWIHAQVSGGGDVSIGLDPAGNVAVDSSAAQAAEIANETTAPAGVSFSAPTDKGSGLSIGNLGPEQVRAIWLRRVVAAATSAISSDGATLRIEGDTAA